MNKSEFNDLISASRKRTDNILNTKGSDYVDSHDLLGEFKSTAYDTGMTKYQVWAIYFNKHIRAVMNSIKKHPDKPVAESEPIESRIDDLHNYLYLLEGMLNEMEITNNTECRQYIPNTEYICNNCNIDKIFIEHDGYGNNGVYE